MVDVDRINDYAGLLEAVSQAADGVVITDDCGNIKFVNPAFTAMTGYSADEALGRNPRILKSGKHSGAFYSTLWNTIGSGQTWSGEVVNRRKDGSLYTEQMRITPIRGGDGQITGHIAIKHDVTEERERERSQALLAAIVENSEDAMVVVTPAGIILAWNRGAAFMFGYSPDEAVGKEVSRCLTAESLCDRTYIDGEIAQGNAISQYESRLLHKDGSAIYVSISGAPIRNSAGQVIAMSAVIRDISERKRAEEAQQDNKNRYRVLFEDSGDANFLTDGCNVLDCNPAARQMFGYDSETPMPHPYLLSPPNQSDGTSSEKAAQRRIESALRNGKERFEWLHRRANGEVFPAEVCLTALTLRGRSVLLASLRDITERRRAEDALLFKTALLEAQAESTMDGILVVDEFDHILLVNKQFGLHFEIPEALLDARDDASLREYMLGKVKNPQDFIERINHLNRDRTEKSSDEMVLNNGKIFDRYSAPLFDAGGQYRGRIWYHRDITERRAAEKRIEFLAYYDTLTELPHRALLVDRLEHALAIARLGSEKIAILFLDLDRFKMINDSYGHSFGDMVLKEIARRLKESMREGDIVSRMSGDEFLILLRNIKDAAEAGAAARRIIEMMNTSFRVQGQPLQVSCSIGVSLFPEHGEDGETLISRADAAMFSAKDSGRSDLRFFTEEMNTQAVERLKLSMHLHSALEKNELSLVYQPQVEIDSGRIIGFEALLRWRHPELGFIPPDKFISIAETNGLILPIGEWVLRTACIQARRWQDDGFQGLRVAVNVSPVQFRHGGFFELVCRVLKETSLEPQHLELELTESLLLSDGDVTLSVFRGLRNMGVELAIDDFGTGYSSLSYLRRFPVGKLKIDRSFVRDIDVDADDAAITMAIISMAKSLHLKVIAEGVENAAQMSFLRKHRCDEIQGYYFSKPISADRTASLIRAQASRGRRELLQEFGDFPFRSASLAANVTLDL